MAKPNTSLRPKDTELDEVARILATRAVGMLADDIENAAAQLAESRGGDPAVIAATLTFLVRDHYDPLFLTTARAIVREGFESAVVAGAKVRQAWALIGEPAGRVASAVQFSFGAVRNKQEAGVERDVAEQIRVNRSVVVRATREARLRREHANDDEK